MFVFIEPPKQVEKLDVDKAAEFIASFEGFSSECYKDGSGYSQGFGSRCKNYSVSKQSGLNTLKAEIKRLDNKIKGNWTAEQRTAIVSFLFNHPQKQKIHIENINNNPEKFLKELKWKSENHIYIGGVRYAGLKKRRKAEYNLIKN